MIASIVLIGGGGHCASCIDALESSGMWKIIGIVDKPELIGQMVLGYPIIASDADLPELASRIGNALISVGQLKDPGPRMRLFEKAHIAGFSLPFAVASTARVSRHAQLDSGTIVLHGAFINARASIGENVIVNTGAIIEHDAAIKSHSHISTGAIVNGGCRVGSGCFVGSGAVLKNGVQICDRVVIGAGTTVVNDIAKPGVYVGCPARKYE